MTTLPAYDRVMVDLLGKPLPEPKKWDPFYCTACTATYSAKCNKHGTRFCGNRGYCDAAVCEACDLAKGVPETERQRDQRIADELRARNYANACRNTTSDEEQAVDEFCPECGEELSDDDLHYMATHDCCKCCYDDYHFGEEPLQ